MKLFFESLFMASLTLSVLVYGCTAKEPEVKIETKAVNTPSSTPVAATTPQPAGSPKPSPTPDKKQDKKPDPAGK